MLQLGRVNRNEASWGPTMTTECLEACLGPSFHYPFGPCSKPDKIVRVCDFTQKSMAGGDGEDQMFQVVDSRPVRTQKKGYQKKNMKQNQQNYQQKQQERHEQMNKQGGKKNKQAQKQMQQRMKFKNMKNYRANNEWSIEPTSEWSLQHELPLTLLPKCPSVNFTYTDMQWAGVLHYFDMSIDKVQPKAPQLLETHTHTHTDTDINLCVPSARDDSVLTSKLFDDDSGVHVAITDQVLSVLMAATQSKFSWHVEVYKGDGKVLIDKPPYSNIDMSTVNECAVDGPLHDNPILIDRPHELSTEGIKVAAQVNKKVLNMQVPPAAKYESISFLEDESEIPTKAYRYRFIKLAGRPNAATESGKKDIVILTRGEVDAKMPGGDQCYMSVRTLNEYGKSSRSWRHQLENQKGALLATEIRNNACKMARWVAQAQIGGCDTIKLAYVTRVNPNANDKHVLLHAQSFKVPQLSVQIGLPPDTAWRIVRGILDVILEKPDGHYVLMKHPSKPQLSLYLPPQTVEEGDIAAVANEGSSVPQDA